MYHINFDIPQHIHFIGIGGISMSGLAEVLLKEGFTVSGSDSADSELCDNLRSKGARVMIGQSADNICPDTDVIVYTAAIHPENPEYAAAVAEGIPMMSRAELLGEMMRNYKVSVAVAGTHGKTTTTSMAAHVMLKADMDPTISVGGILPAIGGNIRVGASENFITEACEYTNSYHSMIPTLAVILNVDEDHLDFFKDLDDIAASFHKFAAQVPASGALVINKDSKKFDVVTEGIACGVITFSLTQDADYTVSDIVYDELGCASFCAYERGEKLGEFVLRVPGVHNVANALAVIAASRHLGIDKAIIAEGLHDFAGADRRFEYKGKMNGVTVIDDYAHHPTEIEATLSAAEKYPHKDLWVVFQPHTFTRTKALLAEFGKALHTADHVVLAKIYPAREQDIYGISSADVAEEVKKYGTDVIYIDTFEEIEDYLYTHCKEGDLLITMGAGNVTNIGPALLAR